GVTNWWTFWGRGGRRGLEGSRRASAARGWFFQRRPWDRVRLTGAQNPMKADAKTRHRIFSISFASVYPHYIAKAEKKGRSKAEVDQIIRWLTGYSQKALQAQIEKKTDLETFFTKAPKPNPARAAITGVICGIRVET